MVRLKREDDPIPGEKPGYLPQYIDEEGKPITVTPSTPYPTKDKELELVKAELQAIKTRLNETLDMQVTGSNVEQLIARDFSVTAGTSSFTNTASHNSSNLTFFVLVDVPHEFYIDILWMSDGIGEIDLARRVRVTSAKGDIKKASEELKSLSKNCQFRVQNRDLVDHLYSIYIYAKGVSK